MLIDDLDQVPKCLTVGIRCLLLVHREKDGGPRDAQKKSQGHLTSKVVHGYEEWLEGVREMRNLQQQVYPSRRLYASLNQRDISAGVQKFKQRQLDIDYHHWEQFHDFYTDIHGSFMSALMKKGARAQCNALIDLDSEEDFLRTLNRIDPKDIVFRYPTKNGFHIIVDESIVPPLELHKENIDVHMDGLLYLG